MGKPNALRGIIPEGTFCSPSGIIRLAIPPYVFPILSIVIRNWRGIMYCEEKREKKLLDNRIVEDVRNRPSELRKKERYNCRGKWKK